MDELLEKAVAELVKLSCEDQQAYARWILAELEDDRRWDESFAKSPDLLMEMAAKARANRKAGLTKELDPDTL